MARRTGTGIDFTGSMGDFSAYRMRGVDGIIIRSKGGASKETIKTSKAFEGLRKHMSEFGGRSTAAKWIAQMIHPLKALADYNIHGPLNSLMKPIQEADTKSEMGKRKIMLTSDPRILEGFSLNRQTILESIVRSPIICNVSRETLSAEVIIPALTPDINFKPHPKYPVYSFQIVLGLVPDLSYSKNTYFQHAFVAAQTLPVLAESKWFSTLQGSEAQKFELKHSAVTRSEDYTVILSVGIRYGSVLGPEKIEQVKYAGAAK